MSDAALTIWISCGSLLVSACSLVVSVAAYRRSDTLRRLNRPSEVSRDSDIRPRLDQLERTIPEAVQSRARASAVLGHGLGAGPQASIPKRVDNAGIEKTKFGRLQRAISLDRTDTRACSRRAAPFPT